MWFGGKYIFNLEITPKYPIDPPKVTCATPIWHPNIDEDGAVVLKEVAALHAGAARLGTDEEVVVNVLEGGAEVAGDHDVVEEGEGAIVELSLDAAEDLLLEGQIEEVQNDTLILAEELATIIGIIG